MCCRRAGKFRNAAICLWHLDGIFLTRSTEPRQVFSFHICIYIVMCAWKSLASFSTTIIYLCMHARLNDWERVWCKRRRPCVCLLPAFESVLREKSITCATLHGWYLYLLFASRSRRTRFCWNGKLRMPCSPVKNRHKTLLPYVRDNNKFSHRSDKRLLAAVSNSRSRLFRKWAGNL